MISWRPFGKNKVFVAGYDHSTHGTTHNIPHHQPAAAAILYDVVVIDEDYDAGEEKRPIFPTNAA